MMLTRRSTLNFHMQLCLSLNRAGGSRLSRAREVNPVPKPSLAGRYSASLEPVHFADGVTRFSTMTPGVIFVTRVRGDDRAGSGMRFIKI